MKMKFFAAATLLLFLCQASFSQKLSFGIKAGADLHKIEGKSFDEEFKFGYHAGAFAEIKLSKIGVQPEIYFSQVSTKNGRDVNSVLGNIDRKIKLSYLNIPVLVNLNFNSVIALQVGPQFGILVNKNDDAQQNISSAFKQGDINLDAGLQVKIHKIRVYGRYVLGLNNQNDLPTKETWKGRTAHLGIGYAIL